MVFHRSREVSLLVVSSLLLGCVAALPPFPPVPREPIERLRQTVTAMTEQSGKVEIPPPPKAVPPTEIECKQSAKDPALWLCRDGSGRMAQGKGLFFAYGGTAEALAEYLASERILRQLVPVLQERGEVRDRMLLAMMDLLETMVVMAEEYRMIAVIRGDEITRLQRDRIIDRFTLLVPVFGIGAGIVYLLAK